jgi:hypothetical protein
MFQFAKSHGYISIVFFISLIIIGQMIFLNLFLAILLENFDDDDVNPETDLASSEALEVHGGPKEMHPILLKIIERA